jgi:hypothetical protein
LRPNQQAEAAGGVLQPGAMDCGPRRRHRPVRGLTRVGDPLGRIAGTVGPCLRRSLDVDASHRRSA